MEVVAVSSLMVAFLSCLSVEKETAGITIVREKKRSNNMGLKFIICWSIWKPNHLLDGEFSYSQKDTWDGLTTLMFPVVFCLNL